MVESARVNSLLLSRKLYACQHLKKKKKKMALPLLRIPGNCSIPFMKPQYFPSKTLRKTTVAAAELQTPVGVSGGSDYRFPSAVGVPTHKVKVHDRQRGIVHEFIVPEVMFPSLSQQHTVKFSTLIFFSVLHFD